ncbi:MAG TPA: MBL fold metallo-hydrolase [Dehalococcoidia bacterium]|nr:MBL fold metallo-hydrolase [Dehalococcoidia bacterium]
MRVFDRKHHRNVKGLTEIVPNVYHLALAWTSVLLLLEEKITVIDAGWRGNGQRVLSTLAQLGRASEEIGYIVSTHYHLDHVGGIAHLQQRSGGRVAAHESEIPYLQDAGLPNPVQNPLIGWLVAPVLSLLRPDRFPVDVPLNDGSRLDILGGLEIVHSPGHTPGSISLHFPGPGLLMVGDALEYRRGKLQLPSRHVSSNMQHARDSVRKLAQLDFEVLCFSHFPPIKMNAARLLKQFAESLS